MYNNTVERLISISNKTKPEKYNILTFSTHERYETELCKTGHNFYSLSSKNFKKWNSKQTPVPTNYHILPEDQLCDFLNFDFILVQSKFGQFQVSQNINRILNLPIICLEHTLPTTQTISANQIEQMRSMRGDINVFISEFSRKAWKIDGIIVHHGVDTKMFSPNNKNKQPNVLTVANDFINRDYCLNYSGWKRVTEGLKVKVVGDTNGLSEAAKSVEDLVDEYNSCGVYFNSSTLSPIPMSLLEAMSCGCAVVSTATCMIPDIIKNGHNGYISNDEDELKKYLKYLLDNEPVRQELGKNARQTIIDMFSEEGFINTWNSIFDNIYEVSNK
jgi:glycosyltransferase involved in cell wall biosynthesis